MSEPPPADTAPIGRPPIDDLRDGWREALVKLRELARATQAMSPSAQDALRLARQAQRFASIAALFEDEAAALAGAVRQGALAAAAAFEIERLHVQGAEGLVLMPLLQPAFAATTEPAPAWGLRRVPIAPQRITLADWLQGYACAVLAGDAATLALLCAPESLAVAVEPPDVIDPFWLPLCAALAALAQDAPEATGRLDDAEAELATAQIVDAAFVELRVKPLIAVCRALAAGSGSGLGAALTDALRAHRAYWDTPDARDDEQGLVAWWPSALAALGRTRGLAPAALSAYLLPALPEVQPPVPALRVELARRAILTDDEARWFLDLAGWPRSRRSHRVVAVGNDLVARYDLPAAAGAPAGQADFVLPDDKVEAGTAAAPAPALDAGQLMLLAERLAGPQAGAASLAEAVACVDAALQRLPAGQDAFEAAGFASPVGRALFEAEPRRFTRSRLVAYRDALAAVPVATPKAHPPAAPPPASAAAASADPDAARLGSLVWIEVIRQQLEPLLRALAAPGGTELAVGLRPHDDDYARVFANAEAAEAARLAYAALWARPPRFEAPRADESTLRIHVAPAGMLADDNDLSRPFPGGYREVASLLDPHRVWVAWKYTRPDQGIGLAYDGLVWCEDHWAWFPKPYRVLRAATAG